MDIASTDFYEVRPKGFSEVGRGRLRRGVVPSPDRRLFFASGGCSESREEAV